MREIKRIANPYTQLQRITNPLVFFFLIFSLRNIIGGSYFVICDLPHGIINRQSYANGIRIGFGVIILFDLLERFFGFFGRTFALVGYFDFNYPSDALVGDHQIGTSQVGMYLRRHHHAAAVQQGQDRGTIKPFLKRELKIGEHHALLYGLRVIIVRDACQQAVKYKN